MKRGRKFAAERRPSVPIPPVSTARPGDERLAVTLTLGDLRELLREATLEIIGEAVGAPPPRLLDRNGLAVSFGCSASLVDKLRREGMPCIMVGCSPRYEIEVCLSWLQTRGEK